MPAETDDPARSAPRRWLIVGCSGSGKSSFSNELPQILDLPVVHLDRHYWRPGWIEPSRAEWTQQVEELSADDSWVMDGNYSGTLEVRLARAEAAVLLDLPRWRCLLGVYSRAIRWKGRVRPDLADGCPEQMPDLDFLRFILTYRRRSRPRVLKHVAKAPHVRFHRLRSRKEVASFLESVAADTEAMP
jgi:adenylate kinase family enzyme